MKIDKISSGFTKNCKYPTAQTRRKYYSAFDTVSFTQNRISDEGFNTLKYKNFSGWLIVKSLRMSPYLNIKGINKLANPNWKNAKNNIEDYLVHDDFHFYLKNGKTKLGIRFENDKVSNLFGEQGENKVNFEEMEIFKKHIAQNDLRLSNRVQRQISKSDIEKAGFEHYKAKLTKELGKLPQDYKIQNVSDVEKILRVFDTKAKIDDNNLLSIDSYPQFRSFTLSDFGINENDMFRYIRKINDDVIFSKIQIESTGALEQIEGSADFQNSQLKDLGKIKKISKDALFQDSKIQDFKNLEYIGGSVFLKKSEIKSLKKLKTIGADADFSNSNIEDLGLLSEIQGSAHFTNSKITSLKNLKFIGENADFSNSKIKDLGSLEKIGKNAIFENSDISSLKNLTLIGKNADFSNSNVSDTASLKYIGGNAVFENSKVTVLKHVKSILGNANFRYSKVSSLPELENIFGNCYWDKCPLKYKELLKVAIKGKMSPNIFEYLTRRR